MLRLRLPEVIICLATLCFPRFAEAEVVVFRDLAFHSLGDATLLLSGTPETGTLIVSNIGSNGLDGVSAVLPEGCCHYSAYWESLSSLDVGDRLRFGVYGSLDGIPDQSLAAFHFEATNTEISLSVELPPGTGLLNQMLVYDGFTFVYHDLIDDVGVAAVVGNWPDGFFVESACSDYLRHSIVFFWNSSTTVSIPDGPTVNAQSIEIISLAFQNTFSMVTMQAAGIPAMSIIEADFALPGSAVGDATPSRPTLEAAFPNPFNPRTTIAFDLPKQTAVSLRVFDVSGRLVRELIDGEIVADGRQEAVWNGRDDTGRRVASGTYFYRLEAGEYSETKRMALIK